MAVSRVDPPDGGRSRRTSIVRRRRNRLAATLSRLLGAVVTWIVMLWLLGSMIALFSGGAGGQWGWGFGFYWFLPLLTAAVIGIAAIGILTFGRIRELR